MLTQQQRTDRMSGLGGSDIAAILGVSPYKTAVDVWLEKTGRAVNDNIGNENAVYWGNVLEDVVAKEYSKRNGVKIQRVNRTIRHSDKPFMLANIDRACVVNNKAPFNYKTGTC